MIEDCHEAIVSKEQWDKVQALIDRYPPIMTGSSCPFYNLFHGLVYCSTCGKSMQVRYEKAGRMDVDRTAKKKREPINKAYYICQTYNCPEERYSTDEDALKSELDALAKRSGEIDALFWNLYQDKSKGILTEQRSMKMAEALEQEQVADKSRTQEIMENLRAASGKNENVRRFISEIRECVTNTELDEAILNRLIDRITIGKVQTVDGEKIQQVKIEIAPHKLCVKGKLPLVRIAG